MNVRFKLINLGRGKFTGKVGATTEEGLRQHIGKHLVSRNISVAWLEGTSKGNIYTGFHKVGEIELLEE